MPGPLAGVKVIEIAQEIQGPYAGLFLADMDADVIKVEMRPCLPAYLLDKPNTVRDFSWPAATSTAAALWIAGAVLPLSADKAMLRPLWVGSVASDPQSASMAGAFQKGIVKATISAGIRQTYSGQYWPCPAVAPELKIRLSNPYLGVPSI